VKKAKPTAAATFEHTATSPITIVAEVAPAAQILDAVGGFECIGWYKRRSSQPNNGGYEPDNGVADAAGNHAGGVLQLWQGNTGLNDH
jgi:hypothetical protein